MDVKKGYIGQFYNSKIWINLGKGGIFSTLELERDTFISTLRRYYFSTALPFPRCIHRPS